MATVNADRVELLISSLLDTLSGPDGYDANEVISAVYTLTARLTRVCVETPTADLDQLRTVIAGLYEMLPKETVN